MAAKRATLAQDTRKGYQPWVDAIVRAGKHPEPIYEFQFHPSRKWRFDVAFLGHLVAVEINGGAWGSGRHVRGQGYLNDLEKLNAGQLLGWTILQITPQQITDGTLSQLLVDVFG